MKEKKKQDKKNHSKKNQQRKQQEKEDVKKTDDLESNLSTQQNQNENSTEIAINTKLSGLRLSSILSRRREQYYNSKRDLFLHCHNLLTSPKHQDITRKNYTTLESLLPLDCELQCCKEFCGDCKLLDSSSQFVYDLYEMGNLEDKVDCFKYLVKIQETLPDIQNMLLQYMNPLQYIRTNSDIHDLMFIICKSMNHFHCIRQEEIYSIPVCFLSRLTCYRTEDNSLCLLRYFSFFYIII